MYKPILVSPEEYFAIEILLGTGLVDREGFPRNALGVQLKCLLINWYIEKHKPLLAELIYLHCKGNIINNEVKDE